MVEVEIRRLGDKEYEIVIRGEDHTLGSLLEKYLDEDPRVATVYYRKPHPAEDVITVYLNLVEDVDPAGLLAEILDKIIEEAREAEKKLLQAYKEYGIDTGDLEA